MLVVVCSSLSAPCDLFYPSSSLLLSRPGDVFQRAESSVGPWARCRPAASDGLLLLLLPPASSQRLWPGHWEHCPIRRRHAPVQCPHAFPPIMHASCSLLAFHPSPHLQPPLTAVTIPPVQPVWRTWMGHNAPPGSHDGGPRLVVNDGSDVRLCSCGWCNK